MGGHIATISHIFVDYENIQPSASEIAAASSLDIRLWILHGAHQHDFPADVKRAWKPIAGRVFFAKSSKAGPNAVDLLLAFCLGEAYNVDRSGWQPARYFIVSRDKDFEALFDHMKSLGMVFHRVPSLSKALSVISVADSAANTATPRKAAKKAVPATPRKPDDTERVIADLRKNARMRPKRRTTLEHRIQSFLGGVAKSTTVQAIVSELERRGVVQFDGKKLIYNFG